MFNKKLKKEIIELKKRVYDLEQATQVKRKSIHQLIPDQNDSPIIPGNYYDEKIFFTGNNILKLFKVLLDYLGVEVVFQKDEQQSLTMKFIQETLTLQKKKMVINEGKIKPGQIKPGKKIKSGQIKNKKKR